VFIDPEFVVLNMEFNIVQETCLGDGTGSIEIITTGNYPPFTHYLNGEQISGSVITNLSMGEYEIRVVDSENCELIETIVMMPEVYMNPEIIANPITGIAPLTVDFDFTVNHADEWTWYFEQGVIDNNKVTSHTFNSFGEHKVILEVNSGPPNNCVETDTITIFVDVIVTIEANNVFTPNGDGYNDFFEVTSQGLSELNVDIYTQWGNKINEITEIDGKWDGRTKGGADAADGTYFYSLQAIGINNKSYEQQGSVLLLRNAAKASPVPSNDIVKIEIFDELEPGITITAYNIFGQVVHSEISDNPDNIILNISSLKSGIYIIKIEDGRNKYFVRIIKS
jgi:gliding motility-associated-like protein